MTQEEWHKLAHSILEGRADLAVLNDIWERGSLTVKCQYCNAQILRNLMLCPLCDKLQSETLDAIG